MANGTGDNSHVYSDDDYMLPDEAYLCGTRKFRYSSDDGDSFRFSPPLYRQRYSTVIEQLRKHLDDMDKVVDFGCAEGGFLSRARSALGRSIRSFVGVDIDDCVLDTAKVVLNADLYDGYNDGFDSDDPSLCVTWLYRGSITEYDQRLDNTDAVTAIELIEHLEEDVLRDGVKMIFSCLRPYLVIFTTPNVEFNVLFNMGKRRFRHDDHKFEWTRKEFQTWCQQIVSSYPKYEVQFFGIGKGPEGTEESIGCASQMAVFRWTSVNSYRRFKEKRLQATRNLVDVPSSDIPYQLITRLVFPGSFRNELYRRKAVLECKEYCFKIYSECSTNSDCLDSTEAPAINTIVRDPHTGVRGMWFKLEELFDLPAARKACETAQSLANILAVHECFVMDACGFNVDCKMVKYQNEDDLSDYNRRQAESGSDDDES